MNRIAQRIKDLQTQKKALESILKKADPASGIKVQITQPGAEPDDSDITQSTTIIMSIEHEPLLKIALAEVETSLLLNYSFARMELDELTKLLESASVK